MQQREVKCDKFKNCTRKKKRSIRRRNLMLLIGISIHPWARKLEEMLKWSMQELEQTRVTRK